MFDNLLMLLKEDNDHMDSLVAKINSSPLGTVVGSDRNLLDKLLDYGFLIWQEADSEKVMTGTIDAFIKAEVLPIVKEGLNTGDKDLDIKIKALDDRALRAPTASAVGGNIKTGITIDFTSSCPHRDAGHPCLGCYVEIRRQQVYDFFKKLLDNGVPYEDLMNSAIEREWTFGKLKGKEFKFPNMHTKQVKGGVYVDDFTTWSRSTINAENAKGGVRLFSSGDYNNTTEEDEMLAKLFADAKERGLKVKAITKSLDFVKKWAKETNITNISIDNFAKYKARSNAPTLAQAVAMKKKYPQVRIRALALNPEEVYMYGNMDAVDIVTPFRGSAKALNADKFPEEVDAGREHIPAVNMQDNTNAYKAMMKELPPKIKAKICGNSDDCSSCALRCGE